MPMCAVGHQIDCRRGLHLLCLQCRADTENEVNLHQFNMVVGKVVHHLAVAQCIVLWNERRAVYVGRTERAFDRIRI